MQRFGRQKHNSWTLMFSSDWWGMGESGVSNMPCIFLMSTSGSIVDQSKLKHEEN